MKNFALYHACLFDFPEQVRELIKRGADVGELYNRNLRTAVYLGFQNTARALCEHGADPYETRKNSYTGKCLYSYLDDGTGYRSALGLASHFRLEDMFGGLVKIPWGAFETGGSALSKPSTAECVSCNEQSNQTQTPRGESLADRPAEIEASSVASAEFVADPVVPVAPAPSETARTEGPRQSLVVELSSPNNTYAFELSAEEAEKFGLAASALRVGLLPKQDCCALSIAAEEEEIALLTFGMVLDVVKVDRLSRDEIFGIFRFQQRHSITVSQDLLFSMFDGPRPTNRKELLAFILRNRAALKAENFEIVV